jgi:hypothetical protein
VWTTAFGCQEQVIPFVATGLGADRRDMGQDVTRAMQFISPK